MVQISPTFDVHAAIKELTVVMYKGEVVVKPLRTPMIEIKLYTFTGKLVLLRSWVFIDELNQLFT